jgi:hypothetical protein
MGIQRPLYKPILTPALSLKEREIGCRMLIGGILSRCFTYAELYSS